MAISQVGSATSVAQGGSNDITVTKPTGVASGDVLIACLTQNENTITPPTGFNLIQEVTAGETTNTWSAHVYYKVCGGSEPASYNFTHNGGTTAPFVCVMSAWRGVSNSSPINTSAESADGGSGEPASGPNVTTTAGNRRIAIRGCRSTTDIVTFSSATSGWSELGENGEFSGGTVRYSICQYARTADDSSGSNQTTPAITASTTETDNGWFHIALTVGEVNAPAGSVSPTSTANAPSKAIKVNAQVIG